MKTFNRFSKGFGPLVNVLFLLSVFIVGCNKQDFTPDRFKENINGPDKKCMVIHKGTIHLQGFTRFGFYAKKGHIVLSDPALNALECTAELTFGEKQSFVLKTQEFMPGNILYRELSFKGKMMPGGEVKFSFPYTYTELDMATMELVEINVGPLPEIRLHTGCVLYGPGISKNTLVYTGYFRNGKFLADSHFIGHQEVPGVLPFLAEIVEGPIMINFIVDLMEVPD
jgi:hypothetical protein